MLLLAEDPRTIFLGQAVKCAGTTMSATLAGVPEDRKVEMPVAEEMQLGMSVGLALAGHVPVSIFPRWNFLLLAASQLVNHLDKMPAKVIVRVGVGSESPLYPGEQHVGDFTSEFNRICRNINFQRLRYPAMIVPAYREALESAQSTVLVEFADLYPK